MLALLLPSGDALAASRIKDITDFEGVRDNQLIGYGLVVGINRTGDKLSNSPFTKQSLVGMLERLGVNIRGINLNSTNIAAVMVTATLPAFVRHGSRIDVTVSALGDASSLLGGTLIATPLMGADDNVLEMAATVWNATTRISADDIVHRTRFNDHKKVFRPSARREFWNYQQAMEWHHLGEGMMAFYDFGVADPTISEMARRAQRFAGFYNGEDPEAPNYDPVHKILRSPFQSSQGPRLEAAT